MLFHPDATDFGYRGTFGLPARLPNVVEARPNGERLRTSLGIDRLLKGGPGRAAGQLACAVAVIMRAKETLRSPCSERNAGPVRRFIVTHPLLHAAPPFVDDYRQGSMKTA